MITLLKILCVTVLASLLAVCVFASRQVALWDLPAEVGGHPWFIATLLDAYWGFLIIWLWIVARETSIGARAGWLLALLLLGNMATAVYVFLQLSRLRAGDPPSAVLCPAPREVSP